MSMLYVRMFGKFSARLDTGDLNNFDARKAQEVFCYLLLRREQSHAREVLAGLFWGDNPTAQAKKSLRQALWQMQTALGMQALPETERALHIEADWVQANPKAALWLDVAEFEQLYNRSRGQHGADLDEVAVGDLCHAAELYTSDLLEGWYQDWCIYERERLQSMYLALLDKLVVHCEVRHKYELGLEYAGQILRYDRAHEQTHRRLMSLYYLAGDRAAALRQYQRCATALREELGVQPAHSTVALYEQIQLDRLQPLAIEVGGPAPPPASAQSLQSLLARLKQRWQMLASLELQIHDDIESLELALQDHDIAQR